MKEIIRLVGFEYKKMFGKKITWITLGTIWATILFSCVISLMGNIEAGGKVVSSRYEDIEAQKREELNYSGEAIDESLLGEAQQAYQASTLEYVSDVYDSEDEWDQYRTYIRPYISLASLVTMAGQDISTSDMAEFYQARTQRMKAMYAAEELTEGELEYHLKLDEQVQKPLEYSYTKAYSRFISLEYTNGLFTLFAVAICTAGIFAGEYSSKVDALMLASKYGKNKVIYAKLLTGFSFAVIVALLFLGSAFVELGIAHGFDGANAAVQVKYLLLSYPLTMGQVVALLIAFGAIAACIVAGVTMLCSAKMKTNFSTLIVTSVLIFGTVFLNVPYRFRVLRMLVSLLPGNIVTNGSALSSQLLRIGKQYFVTYQYAPVIYAVALGILSWFTFRGFKKHQIG